MNLPVPGGRGFSAGRFGFFRGLETCQGIGFVVNKLEDAVETFYLSRPKSTNLMPLQYRIGTNWDQVKQKVRNQSVETESLFSGWWRFCRVDKAPEIDYPLCKF